MLKTRVWCKGICFYQERREQKIKSDPHPRCQYSIFPSFHWLPDRKNHPCGGEVNAWFNGAKFFITTL
jgi:hypothetical protein